MQPHQDCDTESRCMLPLPTSAPEATHFLVLWSEWSNSFNFRGRVEQQRGVARAIRFRCGWCRWGYCWRRCSLCGSFSGAFQSSINWSTKTISFCCHVLWTRRPIEKSCSFATPIESEEAHAKLVALHDASHGDQRTPRRRTSNNNNNNEDFAE